MASTISDSCQGLVLSVTSSTVLGFSMLLFMGSTPFLKDKIKTNKHFAMVYFPKWSASYLHTHKERKKMKKWKKKKKKKKNKKKKEGKNERKKWGEKGTIMDKDFPKKQK
jgi:hypothetical protein